ncbi:hypothetical protein SARC_06526 [Sphaeroforma arctica JP610]|uniref:Uncharacterized protein n=1 Tax=Sphaeroforma arctica JP610 TaxID=667725 RepID=A0A0L0FWY8_9EUKA|nr:hypothetical protein SARC_06526 [Sphaeroforma arctica JP610]KNC81144.1 hypothetical protein SARC_06526 [Sphaeroforma arctica JP610]|eukprot:XP_014155046.1 hypothetical protein SARC_06526 [Sphaeroforma arctica JP610]
MGTNSSYLDQKLAQHPATKILAVQITNESTELDTVTYDDRANDNIQTLEGRLRRITQEQNEYYASLTSRLDTSFVKFKNAGSSKSNNSLCAIPLQAIYDDNQR